MNLDIPLNREIIELEKELDSISIQINEYRKRNENLKRKISYMQSIKAQTPVDEDRVHFNDSLVYKEMARRGINLKFIPQTELLEAEYHSHIEYLINGTSQFIPYIDAAILEDKFKTKQFLKFKGYPVVEGMIFDSTDINKAQAYACDQLGYPVVIKPTKGSGGHFVYCDILTNSAFRRSYSILSKVSINSCILVEKFIPEVDDYRFFIINGEVVSIVKRTPPIVMGDGHSSIANLVAAENFRRMNPRDTCLCAIHIDDFESERCLSAQGLTRDSILGIGESARCRFNANVSTGGECETVTHKIDPSYCETAKSINRLFPHLSVFTVDLLIKNFSLPANEDNYWICECCCINPGLSLHTHPSKGKGDDIISPLVDLIFPETINKT